MNYAADTDARRAFYISWLIVSAALLIALAAPFFISSANLERILPPCEWQVRYGKPCPLCGMTTAFYHISRGDLSQALDAHGESVTVYLLFLANTLLAGFSLVRSRLPLHARRALKFRNNLEGLCKPQH